MDRIYLLLFGSALSITMFIIISFNVIVVIVIVRHRLYKTPINIFILFMAMSDLGIGVFVVSAELTALFIPDDYMGRILCKGCLYYAHANMLCKVTVSVATSLYRFFSIFNSQQGSQMVTYSSSGATIVVCAVIASISFLISLYIIFMYDIVEIQDVEGLGTILCTILPDYRSTYCFIIISEFILIFLLPVVIFITLHVTLNIRLSSKVHPARPPTIPVHHNVAANHRNTLHTMLLILLLYLFCNLPRQIFRFYLYVYPSQVFNRVEVIFPLVNLIAYTNSWLNVIAYVKYNVQLRGAISETIFGRIPSH